MESFSYSISHDLKAPLRAINGFAEIISNRYVSSLNDEAKHYFINIVEASKHMNNLIDDILTLSRIGRKSIKTEPVSLREVFNKIIDEFSVHITQTNTIIKIADDLPVIESDFTLLTQIFSNIIDNAIKYQKKDIPPEIIVTKKEKEKNIIICITDNGIGIPEEHLGKIFNIIQRLHTEDEYPGTGIGLSIVKKSVEFLGGKVWAEKSQGEEGITICVEFPVED
jgi:light-regulated signal transduction histidine kinase (bacteriophytochrome)